MSLQRRARSPVYKGCWILVREVGVKSAIVRRMKKIENSISFVFGPAERIRQPPSQIEPILGVSEQVIGPIVRRKFDNGKGLA